MKTHSADYTLFFSVLAIVVFGMVMISSVSVYPSFKLTSQLVAKGLLSAPSNAYFLMHNVVHVLLGFAFFAIVIKTPYTFFEKHARTIFIGSLTLLAAALVVGSKYNGTRGWINIPFLPFSIQPIEFAKLALIIYLAHFLKRRRSHINSLKGGFVPVMSIFGAVAVLVALQPELGATLVLGPVTLIMFFAGG